MTEPLQLPELPEPIAYRYWSNGHRARWQLAGKHVPPGAEPLLSVEQARAYGLECQRVALEAAAKACDELVHALDNAGVSYHRPAGADRCARAIRSLIPGVQGEQPRQADKGVG